MISLLFSKVWLTINTAPFTGQFHEFPDQGYFMNLGPWISRSMYLAHAAAALVATCMILALCIRKQQPRGLAG